MKSRVEMFLKIFTFLLILLWVYAALSKLADFQHFKKQMGKQALTPFVINVLIYALPPFELVLAALLSFKRSLLAGLYLSAITLLLFTGYVGLAIFGYFAHRPCSCGGILEHLSWTNHLLFNAFFVAINLNAIYLNKRKERRDN
jgi:hypothetical protein